MNAWFGIGASCVVIIGGLGALLRYEIRRIMREVKPNGGNSPSLGDTAKRTERAVDDVRVEQSRVSEELAATRFELANHVRHDEMLQDALLLAVKALGKPGE